MRGILEGSSMIIVTMTTTAPMFINTIPCHEEAEKRSDEVGVGVAIGSSGGRKAGEAGGAGGEFLSTSTRDFGFKRLILIMKLPSFQFIFNGTLPCYPSNTYTIYLNDHLSRFQ